VQTDAARLQDSGPSEYAAVGDVTVPCESIGIAVPLARAVG
jgi:hypothetical protein